jgi:cellulose synthase/poly-beta-1,6-N-acetylglucosamine synthase-like glycosyltransferase
MTLLNLCLCAVACPALLSSTYLLLLTALSAAPRPPPRSSRTLRFDVIVPAHDEAAGIARTVDSLRRIDWPSDRYRILVIADNCSDATAEIARAAGAVVLERHDKLLRGKGYALDYAFGASQAAHRADAVVVVDADAEVSPNILEAFAARIEQGEEAVQAHYGVRNPHSSWRTRLMAVAKGAFHIVRSRARERMKVSCGLRGNGWCVTHALLRRVPYRAFSLTEDLEYGIELALSGVRVAYADEAHADADMVSGEATARKQRERWEHGRFGLIRSRTVPLLRAALRRRSRVCLDLALDLLVLPLSYVALNIGVLAIAAAAATAYSPTYRPWLSVAAGCAFAVATYVGRGWKLSDTGLRGLADLLRAPWFLAWKLMVMMRSRGHAGWTRTGREDP